MGQYLFTRQGMDSRWLVPIRLWVAGVGLFVFCLIKYKKTLFAPWRERSDALRLIAYGLPGVSCCQFTYFLTIQLSNAGTATILQNLSPIPIMFVECIRQRRKPRPYELASLVLGMTGVFLITTHGRLDQLAVPMSALLTGTLCALTVTIYNVVPGELLKKYPVTVLQTWAFLMGAALMTPIFRPWSFGYKPSLIAVGGLLFVAVVGNVIAFNVYIAGVKYIGSEKAILYGFSEPITAALVTTLALGSPFGFFDAAGFVAVFAMLALLSFGSLRTEKRTPPTLDKPAAG